MEGHSLIYSIFLLYLHVRYIPLARIKRLEAKATEEEERRRMTVKSQTVRGSLKR